jgi:hypothetical protein
MMMMVAPRFIRISIFCAFGAINGPIIYSGPLVLSRLFLFIMKSGYFCFFQFTIPNSKIEKRREATRTEEKRSEVKLSLSFP